MDHLIMELAWNIEKMDSMFFIGALFFTGTFATFAGIIAIIKFRAYRVVADTPTSLVRSAPQGYVELKGQFEPLNPDEPIYAPFTGKPCVWYRVYMEEARKSGDDVEWVTVYSESDPRPFRLVDETGQCFILPNWANLRLKTVSEYFRPRDLGLPSSQVRYCEERIEAGPGYVIGHLTTTDGAEVSKTDDILDESLKTWRTDYMEEIGGNLKLYHPNTTPKEWDYNSTAQQIGHWLNSLGKMNGPFHIIGPSQEPRRMFIVGSGDEENIENGLRRIFVVSTCFSIVLSTCFLFLLVSRLGAWRFLS